jgi:hypothetical protein
MMEAMNSSETSVLTRAVCRNNPGDFIFHSHRCEYLKAYKINRRSVMDILELDVTIKKVKQFVAQ